TIPFAYGSPVRGSPLTYANECPLAARIITCSRGEFTGTYTYPFRRAASSIRPSAPSETGFQVPPPGRDSPACGRVHVPDTIAAATGSGATTVRTTRPRRPTTSGSPSVAASGTGGGGTTRGVAGSGCWPAAARGTDNASTTESRCVTQGDSIGDGPGR